MRKKHFQTHVHFKSSFFLGGWSSTFSGVQFGMLPAGMFFKRKMGPVSATKKKTQKAYISRLRKSRAKNPTLENDFVSLEVGFASTRCSPGTGRENTKSNTLLSKVYPTINFQVLCELQGESEKSPN